MTYFDRHRGYVVPDDDCESDTSTSLKEIITALKYGQTSDGTISSATYDAVERLLYKYSVFVRQGIRENIANHKGVSWYLTEDACGRAFVSYQDAPYGEWFNDCYADEVPLWLLLGILNRITLRKPLGDQVANDTIKGVKEIDKAYANEKLKASSEISQRGFSILGYPPSLRRDSNV